MSGGLPTSLLYVMGVCFVVPFVLGALLMLLAGRRYRFQAGMIHGVFGELGTGKSQFVVGRTLRPVCRAMSSRKGLRDPHLRRPIKRVIVNFELRPERWGCGDVEVVRIRPTRERPFWQQVLSLMVFEDGDWWLDAVVVMDEAALFHPSDERDFDEVARLALTNLRKVNGIFVFIATDHMLVHKRLRKFATRMWIMREDEGILRTLTAKRWFVAEGCRRDDNGLPVRPAVDRQRFMLRKRTVEAYNSFEVITSDFDELLAFELAVSELSASSGDGSATMQEPQPQRFGVNGIAALSSDGQGSATAG